MAHVELVAGFNTQWFYVRTLFYVLNTESKKRHFMYCRNMFGSSWKKWSVLYLKIKDKNTNCPRLQWDANLGVDNCILGGGVDPHITTGTIVNPFFANPSMNQPRIPRKLDNWGQFFRFFQLGRRLNVNFPHLFCQGGDDHEMTGASEIGWLVNLAPPPLRYTRSEIMV